MKRNKLISDVAFDFYLIGIISPKSEHQLAWNLNQIPELHFIKKNDITIDFKDLSRISISNYVCQTETHLYTLLKNKLESSSSQKIQMLLPELSQFDYFVKFQSQIDDFNFNGLFQAIREIPVITYTVKLDTSKIKQKDNLLY